MTPLVRMLCHYWGLDAPTARRWWRAVARARWSVAQAWRRQVLLFDQRIVRPLSGPQALEAVERFLRTQASPQQVIGVVEALRQEGLLSRHDSTCLEEKMLARVTREGQWK